MSTFSSGAFLWRCYRLCKLISSTFSLQKAALSSSSVRSGCGSRRGAMFDAAATCQLFGLAGFWADCCRSVYYSTASDVRNMAGRSDPGFNAGQRPYSWRFELLAEKHWGRRHFWENSFGPLSHFKLFIVVVSYFIFHTGDRNVSLQNKDAGKPCMKTQRTWVRRSPQKNSVCRF